MFFPAPGLTEDPATGSAVASLAGALMQFEPMGNGEHSFAVEQGVEMGRPSRIELQLVIARGALASVEIGGGGGGRRRGKAPPVSEALPDAAGSRAPTGDFIRRFREIDARFEPRPWSWAEERREAIAAYWARRAAAQPSLFNGRVLLIGDHAIEGDVFRATYFATDYANFLYWLDRGTPDRSVFNGFAMGAGQGSDGGYVLGVMGAHTATAGKVYFPAGTPDPGDLRPDGTVDLATSVVREMEEETGLRPGDYTVADGWIAVRTGGLIALHAAR